MNKFDHPRFYQWFLWLSEKGLFKFKIVVFYLETNINDFDVWNYKKYRNWYHWVNPLIEYLM